MESVVVKNLTKKFGSFTAVDNISFSVKKGEIFGFLGPNGAGKTTTIKMLCGIISPTSGEGKVAGYDIIREQERIREKIGYMSQKFSLYDDMTIEENLSFYGSIYGLDYSILSSRINEVLDAFDIKEQRNAIVGKLPQGIKQRLALATAIIHKPSILFLDEPTSGVDPLMRRKFWDLIYWLAREGKTIFVTTHYMDEAEYCDRIALIIGGRLIAIGSPHSLKEELNYNVYKIETKDYLTLFHKLSEWVNTIEVALFGNDIHLITEENLKLKNVREELLNLGFEDARIEKIPPSLEDVFVMKVKETQKQ